MCNNFLSGEHYLATKISSAIINRIHARNFSLYFQTHSISNIFPRKLGLIYLRLHTKHFPFFKCKKSIQKEHVKKM